MRHLGSGIFLLLLSQVLVTAGVQEMFVEQNQTLVFCARNVILTLPVGAQSEQSFV